MEPVATYFGFPRDLGLGLVGRLRPLSQHVRRIDILLWGWKGPAMERWAGVAPLRLAPAPGPHPPAPPGHRSAARSRRRRKNYLQQLLPGRAMAVSVSTGSVSPRPSVALPLA